MKTMIYYFSGTGNSLAAAKELQKNLGESAELFPIAKYHDEQWEQSDCEVLGIIFPVYFLSVPEMVRSFIKRLNFRKPPYIFAIATCNAVPGHSLYTVRRLLKAKGWSLAVGYVLDMPGNAILNPPEVQAERLSRSKEKLLQISRKIRERSTNIIEGGNDPVKYVRGWIIEIIVKRFSRPDKRFSVESTCTHCGVCARVCPRKNITLKRETGPVWGRACEMCLACYHWCPRRAVIMGKKDSNKTRYHHPEIALEDMKM